MNIGPKVDIVTPNPMRTATRARFFPGEDRMKLADPWTEGERLRTALAPQALLFDVDGVLIDTTASYDAAILATAAELGVTLSTGNIAERRARGDANNRTRKPRHSPHTGPLRILRVMQQRSHYRK